MVNVGGIDLSPTVIWDASLKLKAERDRLYPRGTIVVVNHPRFHGYGVVVSDECPVHQLAVRLENDNVWWYEIETVSRYAGRLQDLPWAIRKLKLRTGRIVCGGDMWLRKPRHVLPK